MSSDSIRVPKVAVIGGGIAGAVCSQLLSRRGAHVDVFDMGRQLPGGRASSRTTSARGGEPRMGGVGEDTDVFAFDYGCQFFQATSPVMKRLVAEWLETGMVAEWRPRTGVYDMAAGAIRRREELTAAEAEAMAASGLPPLPSPSSGPLYVGSPSMGALVARLLEGGGGGGGGSIRVRLNTRVHSATWSGGRWQLVWGPQQRPQRGGDGAAGSQSPSPQPKSAGTCCGEGDGVYEGVYDAVVLTDSQVARPGSPGHVAFADAPPSLEQLAERLRAQRRLPQFALMVGWRAGGGGGGAGAAAAGGEGKGAADGSRDPLRPPSMAAAVTAPSPRLPVEALHVLGGSAVQWVAVDSSKPGRSQSNGGGSHCWVALTRTDFAATLLAAEGAAAAAAGGAAGCPQPAISAPRPPASPEYRARKAAEIWEALQRDLRGLPGLGPLPPPSFLTAHRWSSCFSQPPLGETALWDAGGMWAACGDFCGGPGLERAAGSGAAAAEAVANMLGLAPATPSANSTAPPTSTSSD